MKNTNYLSYPESNSYFSLFIFHFSFFTFNFSLISLQYPRLCVAVVHCTLDIAVLATMIQSDDDFQVNHIAVVPLSLGDFLVDVATEDLSFVRHWVAGEEVLGK